MALPWAIAAPLAVWGGRLSRQQELAVNVLGRHHHAKILEQMLAGGQEFVTYLQGF